MRCAWRGVFCACWLAGGTARGAAENVPTVLVLATEDSQSRLEAEQIAAGRLPEGSRILNRPFGFVGEYKWWVLGGAVVIVLEGLIILQLGLGRVLRRRAVRALGVSGYRYRPCSRLRGTCI